MTDVLTPGAGILFMKVGTHAQETLEDIIARKTKEIEDAGYALWGYGGGTCHPQNAVQPFARIYEGKGMTVRLCMEEMNSQHFAEKVRADQSSIDGIKWQDIPPAINVLGSRYALVIKNLHREEFDLQLNQTQVAVGMNMGRAGDRYIVGRVDKGCLEFTGKVETPTNQPKIIHINLVAELAAPYAVFLRNVA